MSNSKLSTILILGAGRSSTVLIEYLLENAISNNWQLIVADSSLGLAESKIKGHGNAKAVSFDVLDDQQRNELIRNSSAVVSLLPPPMHAIVANSCIEQGVSLFTASYVSNEIASLNDEAIRNNILILMETGLDPGIDHMSAMKEIELIRQSGSKLLSFKSYTGGLIAPESDDNPWHYKITWNPRNVVLAGKGISKYLADGKISEVQYEDLFTHTAEIYVEGFGEFEGYPNRDSLSYLSTYSLHNVHTFLRGTLRRPGFASSWNLLVKAGFTNDELKLVRPTMSYLDLALLITGEKSKEALIQFFRTLGGSDEDISRIEWLGCFSEKIIPLESGTPADALQILLEVNLKLKDGDKDMIVMQHQFVYEKEGRLYELTSSLVVTGDDELHTAMAKTVGLPLAIAVKNFLNGQIKMKGVQVPIGKDIYEPILNELSEKFGITFINKVKDL